MGAVPSPKFDDGATGGENSRATRLLFRWLLEEGLLISLNDGNSAGR